MGWQTLFRKYRPRDFSEVAGQHHITKILENSIKSGRISSAYLFCGPRGTGKTSTARILAKSLNCFKGASPKPCQECEMCRRISESAALDVIEIDAASNTQVEKVREFIIQRVAFAPTQGKYKIYIIDEVHKLSDSAFNALLKTLEEPPAHTVFILATTHPQKLLPTILSRCQRYDFCRISTAEIIDYLREISQKENIKVESRALELMAQESDGSLRDALVFLEQSANYNELGIKYEEVITVLGITSREKLHSLAQNIVSGDIITSLEILKELTYSGIDLDQLVKDFLRYFRGVFLTKIGRDDWVKEGWGVELFEEMKKLCGGLTFREVMMFLKILLELKAQLQDSSISQIVWEMAVVRMAKGDNFIEGEEREGQEKGQKEEKKHENRQKTQEIEEKVEKQRKTQETEDGLEKQKKNAKPGIKKEIDLGSFWPEVMKYLKKKKIFLHAILLEAKPLSIDEGVLEIGLKKEYAFHVEKIKEYREEIEDIIKELIKRKVRIDCKILENGEIEKEDKVAHGELVAEAMDLFGGKMI